MLVIFIVVMAAVAGAMFAGYDFLNAGGIAIFVLLIIALLVLIGLEVYFALVIQSFGLEIIAGGSGSGLPYPN